MRDTTVVLFGYAQKNTGFRGVSGAKKKRKKKQRVDVAQKTKDENTSWGPFSIKKFGIPGK